MIAKFAKILRVTGVKTGVGVLIFDVNRSRNGVRFCNFGAGLESESQKSDSGHLCYMLLFSANLPLKSQMQQYVYVTADSEHCFAHSGCLD